MFPSARTSTIAQRALGAARLARSFLLLEDDYDVDWEVDQDQRDDLEHPHRAQLRNRAIAMRLARRRPGQVPAHEQLCLSPIRRDDHTVTPAKPRPKLRRVLRATR
jgi:hypothetical protein